MSAPDLVALQAIGDAVRAGWPLASLDEIRRCSLAVAYQTGHIHPERVAIGIRVVEACAAGVRAGAWPDAEELTLAIDLILGALDFALAEVSAVELVMLLRLLSTGHAEAVGIEVGPEVAP